VIRGELALEGRGKNIQWGEVVPVAHGDSFRRRVAPVCPSVP
jgi:hypothetical protein